MSLQNTFLLILCITLQTSCSDEIIEFSKRSITLSPSSIVRSSNLETDIRLELGSNYSQKYEISYDGDNGPFTINSITANSSHTQVSLEDNCSNIELNQGDTCYIVIHVLANNSGVGDVRLNII